MMHVPPHEIRIAALEEEVERLRQRLELFEGKNNPVSFPALKLGPHQAAILNFLMRHGKGSTESLLSAMPVFWADECDRNAHVVHVQIHRLRKKLKPIGAEIFTLYGFGFELPSRSKAVVLQHVEATS